MDDYGPPRYNKALDMYDWEWDEAVAKAFPMSWTPKTLILSPKQYKWYIENGYIKPDDVQVPN